MHIQGKTPSEGEKLGIGKSSETLKATLKCLGRLQREMNPRSSSSGQGSVCPGHRPTKPRASKGSALSHSRAG